jgi:3-isopropylmalate/(R)-2-methylmalate dehydratase small subunit
VAGITAVCFSCIFLRNCIKLGLSVLICPEVDNLSDSDELNMDLDSVLIENRTMEVW